MTNLFSHLAARSLGLTPIVQPRIDSRFSAKTAVEPTESVPLPGLTKTEFNQPGSNETNAIVESSREDATAFSLVNPAANQNLSPLPIAHVPRPIAFERVMQADDRDSSHDIRDTANRNQPILNERSIRGDRPVVDSSSDSSPNISSDVNTNANQTGREINLANQTAHREPVLRTDVEPDSEISRRTNQPKNIQGINTQDIQQQDIQQTEIESSSVHPAAVQKTSSFRAVPQPSGSILPAAEIIPSAITESTIESTTGDFTRSAIDSRILQERSDLQPSSPRNPLPSPQPIPAVMPEGKQAAGDRLDAVEPLDRSSTVQSPVQSPARPERLEPEPIARAQPRTVPRTVSPMQPAADRIEVRSRAGEVSPDVLPRQTAVLMPTLPSDRSATRAIEQEAPAALPTIRVTIGRIEVRAVSTPAPARPRAATTPARLSLEDYLRSRSGGNV